MREFAVPKVVVSKCVEFEPCRYNAQMIASDFVKMLKPHVEFLPVCPEYEIGLGVPRDSVRLVSKGEDEVTKLIQPASGRDVTEEMRNFARSFLQSLEEVDGFILKAGSPSCGIKNAKIYPGSGKGAPISKTATGLFGREVLERYSHLAVEDEGRLRNARIKEHFLTKLYTIAKFRDVKRSHAINELVRFQTENKLLLMAYSQIEAKALGNIVANHEHRPFAELVEGYQQHLFKALSRAPRYTSNINVLMHALGHYSDQLNDGEKALFLDNLQRYRAGKVTICPNKILLRSWATRFEDEYLMSQTFFAPYPPELMVVDPIVSHRGRDLWGGI